MENRAVNFEQETWVCPEDIFVELNNTGGVYMHAQFEYSRTMDSVDCTWWVLYQSSTFGLKQISLSKLSYDQVKTISNEIMEMCALHNKLYYDHLCSKWISEHS